MKLWGRGAAVETSEVNGELIFRTRRQLTVVDFLVPAGFCAYLVHSLLRRHLPASVFAVVGLLAALNDVLAPGAELRFTDKELIASGRRRWFSRVELVRWAEVTEIQYSLGPENDPSGLYVSTGYWSRQRCLMPKLDREQTGVVIDAIFRRFPDLRLAEETPGRLGLLLGGPDEVISLGLSGGKR